jgi:hypothetical protein
VRIGFFCLVGFCWLCRFYHQRVLLVRCAWLTVLLEAVTLPKEINKNYSLLKDDYQGLTSKIFKR